MTHKLENGEYGTMKRFKTCFEKLAWRKNGTMIKFVIEENPIRKRLLGRPRIRWEDYVKRR